MQKQWLHILKWEHWADLGLDFSIHCAYHQWVQWGEKNRRIKSKQSLRWERAELGRGHSRTFFVTSSAVKVAEIPFEFMQAEKGADHLRPPSKPVEWRLRGGQRSLSRAAFIASALPSACWWWHINQQMLSWTCYWWPAKTCSNQM